MKKYIKDNKIINEGSPIKVGDLIIYHPTAKVYADNGWEEYIEPEKEISIDEVKQNKIIEIDTYDTSSDVNTFFINSEPMWLNKTDRMGLVNSTNMLKESGEETCTLWGNGTNHTIPCDNLLDMLRKLEIYALACYNTTAKHKIEINNLQTIEEINSFDITKDYPEKLNFII